MMYLTKTALIFLFLLLVLIMFAKSIANAGKLIVEIKTPPQKETVKICPPKNDSYFKKLPDTDYMKDLYNYLSLGVKC
jgi:hypothetical protein